MWVLLSFSPFFFIPLELILLCLWAFCYPKFIVLVILVQLFQRDHSLYTLSKTYQRRPEYILVLKARNTMWFSCLVFNFFVMLLVLIPLALSNNPLDRESINQCRNCIRFVPTRWVSSENLRGTKCNEHLLCVVYKCFLGTCIGKKKEHTVICKGCHCTTQVQYVCNLSQTSSPRVFQHPDSECNCWKFQLQATMVGMALRQYWRFKSQSGRKNQ
jgi:hypothetical protein